MNYLQSTINHLKDAQEDFMLAGQSEIVMNCDQMELVNHNLEGFINYLLSIQNHEVAKKCADDLQTVIKENLK